MVKEYTEEQKESIITASNGIKQSLLDMLGSMKQTKDVVCLTRRIEKCIDVSELLEYGCNVAEYVLTPRIEVR